MPGLIEIPTVTQTVGEPRRRWFVSQTMDLVVWCDASGHPSGFQLCYDADGSQRALTWQPDRGFTHRLVDDGEGRHGKYKATPILLAECPVDANQVAARFAGESAELPPEIAAFVTRKLREHPDYVPEP